MMFKDLTSKGLFYADPKTIQHDKNIGVFSGFFHKHQASAACFSQRDTGIVTDLFAHDILSDELLLPLDGAHQDPA